MTALERGISWLRKWLKPIGALSAIGIGAVHFVDWWLKRRREEDGDQ